MAESYDDEGIYEEEVPEGGGGEPLHELLSHAPWWMVSVFVHAVALIVIMLLSSAPPAPHVVTSFEVSMLNDETIPPDDQEEAWEEEKELDPEKEPVEDPVHKPNAEVSDHPESDVDKDFKENLGKNENAISDTECNAKSTHTTFGLGAGAAGAFTGRGGGADRAERGDGRGTKRPTDDGLRWLAAHQDKARGCWDSDDFQAQCKNNTCSGRGVDWGDPGVTGIALLAFLGAGNTNQKGKYKETVKLGLKYLTEIQDDDGCFGPRGKISMYNHAIAALAMAEAYGMTESGLLKDPAQKGIDFLVSAQNPGFGWRYTAKPGDNDTSVTGWAVMALKSARVSELSVPKEAFEGAKNWLDSVTDDQYRRTGYMQKGDTGARPREQIGKFAPAETCSAISIMSRVFMGAERGEPLLKAQGDLLSQNLPRWDTNGGPGGTSRIDFYYWYYGTLAMFQLGDDYWKTWNEAMKTAIVGHQRKDGDERGSWDPIDVWGNEGGRVYATALNVLSLEIYYRYDRAFK